jgi:Tfp pilus assembly protein PilP
MTIACTLVLLLPLTAAAAGAPSPQAKRPAAVAPAAPTPVPAPGPPPVPDNYSYRPEGRRDPFVSLVNRGPETRQGARKIEGLGGLSANEVVLKGILQSKGSFIAIVQGPDTKRPFIVHANDRLADGVIKAITADSLLILQEVTDPLSLTKQREIRKSLRVVEEVK